ncbi:hypothetical protein M9Y10_003520 [Tritrichomonas musculus]|uniref:Protein kinase domain-containing protein n=1 Tax=Tritrichomonas musculus TaxID=1915356 RepID=A0ABR2JPL7_9EUKA
MKLYLGYDEIDLEDFPVLWAYKNSFFELKLTIRPIVLQYGPHFFYASDNEYSSEIIKLVQKKYQNLNIVIEDSQGNKPKKLKSGEKYKIRVGKYIKFQNIKNQNCIIFIHIDYYITIQDTMKLLAAELKENDYKKIEIYTYKKELIPISSSYLIGYQNACPDFYFSYNKKISNPKNRKFISKKSGNSHMQTNSIGIQTSIGNAQKEKLKNNPDSKSYIIDNNQTSNSQLNTVKYGNNDNDYYYEYEYESYDNSGSFVKPETNNKIMEFKPSSFPPTKLDDSLDSLSLSQTESLNDSSESLPQSQPKILYDSLDSSLSLSQIKSSNSFLDSSSSLSQIKSSNSFLDSSSSLSQIKSSNSFLDSSSSLSQIKISNSFLDSSSLSQPKSSNVFLVPSSSLSQPKKLDGNMIKNKANKVKLKRYHSVSKFKPKTEPILTDHNDSITHIQKNVPKSSNYKFQFKGQVKSIRFENKTTIENEEEVIRKEFNIEENEKLIYSFIKNGEKRECYYLKKREMIEFKSGTIHIDIHDPNLPFLILNYEDIANLQKGKILDEDDIGIAYEAYSVEDNKKCILKEITNYENMRNLLQEHEVLKMFEHPYLLKTYGIFLSDENNPPSIVFEPYTQNLETLTKNKRLNQVNIFKIVHHIAEGMRYVHFKSIIHRNLNPRNIFITVDKKVKIGGFGISKLISAEEQLTFSQSRQGDLRYLAPELKNDQYDRTVDVYSFGVLFLYLLNTGLDIQNGKASQSSQSTF